MHSSSSIGALSSYKLAPTKWGTEMGLPLVPCPECGKEVLELVAGSGSKVPGAVFFKCRLHERNDPTSCPWYLFADKYEQMLIRKGLIGAKQVVPDTHTKVEVLGPAGGDRDSAVPMLVPIGD